MTRKLKESDFGTVPDRSLLAVIDDFCIKLEQDTKSGMWGGTIGKYPDDSTNDVNVLRKTLRSAIKSQAIGFVIDAFNNFYADKEPSVREITKSDVKHIGGCSVYAADGYLGVASIVKHGNISTSIFKLDTLDVVSSSICHAAQIEPAAELVAVWNNKFPVRPTLDEVVSTMDSGRAVYTKDILHYLKELQRLESHKTS